MSHPRPGTEEYRKHVDEEIEHYGALFEDGEGRETLQQPIPPSWQECERRAAMVVHAKTGAFLNGHVESRLNARAGTRFLSLGSGPGGMEIEYAKNARGSHFVCMDINPGLLDLGRQRAAELGLDMSFVPADLNTVECRTSASRAASSTRCTGRTTGWTKRSTARSSTGSGRSTVTTSRPERCGPERSSVSIARSGGASAPTASPRPRIAAMREPAAVRQPMKPRSGVAKRPMFGNTCTMSTGGTPNHLASVAPYWSIDVVGIQRPTLSASFGPASASCGYVP